MATDVGTVLINLISFYDFSNKAVIHVGAGGGQLIGYAGKARSVLGVDPDPAAVERLETALRGMKLEDRFNVLQAEFSSVTTQADVVFFEFCLHEMQDPKEALLHARALAPEILVLDHLPGSPWSWYTCEKEKAERSWAAASAMEVLRQASFKAVQLFKDHAELHSKVQPLGAPAIERVAGFAGERDIKIEMDYAAALLR